MWLAMEAVQQQQQAVGAALRADSPPTADAALQWQHLLTLLPKDTEDQKMVQNAIDGLKQ